jgi:hypothetical protein
MFTKENGKTFIVVLTAVMVGLALRLKNGEITNKEFIEYCVVKNNNSIKVYEYK